ncbi:unnamed protein product [Paramecium sonneborni]|uniref:Uncharacterized protein n=1 Tax=Paramecium sonneborni TaxID=65129 RepID=A0A8S1PNG4_9CILI|nr:unnamed protein product [Paramecium sonneborni]
MSSEFIFGCSSNYCWRNNKAFDLYQKINQNQSVFKSKRNSRAFNQRIFSTQFTLEEAQ